MLRPYLFLLRFRLLTRPIKCLNPIFLSDQVRPAKFFLSTLGFICCGTEYPRAPPSRQEKGPLLYSSRGPDFHAADFIVVCQLYGAIAVTRQVFPFPANRPAPEVRNVCRIKDVSTSEQFPVPI